LANKKLHFNRQSRRDLSQQNRVCQKKLNPGLPDGLFSNQKSQFVYILVGRGMENVGIFMTVWSILRPIS
jgi:hypothetical protein